ncbi:MAG: hypothetical protein ABI382_06170 [Nakamurella sp.]
MERSGLLLGISAPTVKRPTLRYLVVNSGGTILWRADPPATCSGFALSQTEAGPVAVLTDLNIDGGAVFHIKGRTILAATTEP